MTTPTVKFTRLTATHRRWKRGRGSSLMRGHVRAFVDGFLVTKTVGKPWQCSCLDADCTHPDAVASLVADEVLDHIEAEGGDE
ncbi:hypothetical protein NYE39_02235 [Janibacter sp. FSL W8-0316]|uniref:hypothetical protein n=1 Tax=Janibacter sp. FSL W8-0316 TaxID=2975325 RepID=UPI0030FB30F7